MSEDMRRQGSLFMPAPPQLEQLQEKARLSQAQRNKSMRQKPSMLLDQDSPMKVDNEPGDLAASMEEAQQESSDEENQVFIQK